MHVARQLTFLISSHMIIYYDDRHIVGCMYMTVAINNYINYHDVCAAIYYSVHVHVCLAALCIIGHNRKCVCVCVFEFEKGKRERIRIWEQLVCQSPEEWQKILSYIPNPAGVVPLHYM